MGKLITVVGNSGVGKTAFTRQLCRAAGFDAGLEQHAERPFQDRYSHDLSKYALANQIDYLLFRAEQEHLIRRNSSTGVQDGGLDQDFHVFTRLFNQRGYLSEDEYRLCERTYALLRGILPPPDLIIRLVAPLDLVASRYAQRIRSLEIARLEDLAQTVAFNHNGAIIITGS